MIFCFNHQGRYLQEDPPGEEGLYPDRGREADQGPDRGHLGGVLGTHLYLDETCFKQVFSCLIES